MTDSGHLETPLAASLQSCNLTIKQAEPSRCSAAILQTHLNGWLLRNFHLTAPKQRNSSRFFLRGRYQLHINEFEEGGCCLILTCADMSSFWPIRVLQTSAVTNKREEEAGHGQFCFQKEKKKSFLKLERWHVTKGCQVTRVKRIQVGYLSKYTAYLRISWSVAPCDSLVIRIVSVSQHCLQHAAVLVDRSYSGMKLNQKVKETTEPVVL